MMPDLKYYLAVFLRRIHYFVLVVFLCSAAAVTAAFKLPPEYEASSRLLMQSAQIPDSLAAPTIQTEALEQLQIIEQRLMTRANLLEIARRFRVYDDIDTMTPDEIVASMRSDTRITKQAGRDQATLMTLTFTAGSAQAAAGVVNEYVTRILADSVGARTAQAQDTLQFFQQEVDRLATDISTQSARILDFQNANADALPDTLDYRLTLQASLQERLATMDRDIAGLNDQKQRLVEIFRATGQVAGTPEGVEATPEAKLLASLQSELAGALVVYSPENPKIKLLEARIAQLEATVAAQAPAEGVAEEAPPMSLLDIQLAELDARVTQLETQRTDVVAQLDALKVSIEKTAGNAIQLEALRRDYENTQAQYNTATDRLAKASTGERIELLAKGERIVVLDSATVPDAPSKPNRPKIVAAGFGGGIMAGLGLVVLIELLNNAVQRPVELVRSLGITPIGTIPYVLTPGERLRRRALIGTAMLVVLAGVPAAIWAVDTYYLPLDLVLARVTDRLGL